MASPRTKTNFFFEIEDIQVSEKCIIAAIKAAWTGKGNLTKDLADLTIYVKAEDKKAYFVANDCSVTGHVVLSNADDLSPDVIFD